MQTPHRKVMVGGKNPQPSSCGATILSIAIHRLLVIPPTLFKNKPDPINESVEGYTKALLCLFSTVDGLPRTGTTTPL